MPKSCQDATLVSELKDENLGNGKHLYSVQIDHLVHSHDPDQSLRDIQIKILQEGLSCLKQ